MLSFNFRYCIGIDEAYIGYKSCQFGHSKQKDFTWILTLSRQMQCQEKLQWESQKCLQECQEQP